MLMKLRKMSVDTYQVLKLQGSVLIYKFSIKPVKDQHADSQNSQSNFEHEQD